MAKVLGIAEIIAGIAIDVVTAGAGNWLIGAGVATLGSAFLTPSIPQDGSSQAPRDLTITDTDAYGYLVYGEDVVGGIRSYINVSGSNNEILDIVTAHAYTDVTNGVESMTDIYLDDVLIPDADINGSGDVIGGIFSGMVNIQRYDGTQASTDADLLASYSADPDIPWLSTALGKGVAWTRVRIQPGDDSEAFQKAFSSPPQAIKVKIKGEKVYSLETMTTAWSDNVVYCIRDFMTRTDNGCGLPSSILNDVDNALSAGVCDDVISYPGTGRTGPRFTLNGTVQLGTMRRDVITQMLSAMAGEAIQTGGTVGLYSGSFTASSGALDSTFLRGTAQKRTALQNERYNYVTASFRDKNNQYQNVPAPSYPAIGSSNYTTWVAADGERIDKNVTLPFTNNADNAQIIEQIIANQSRYLDGLTLECNARGQAYKAGDRVSVTLDELKLSRVLYKIVKADPKENFGIDLTLKLDASGIWDFDHTLGAEGGSSTAAMAAYTTPPDPSGVTAVGTADGIDLSWDVDPSHRVTRYQIWRCATSGGTYILIDEIRANAYHDPHTDGSTWYYKIRAANGTAFSGYSAIVTATAKTVADGATDGAPDGSPVSNRLAQDVVSLTIANQTSPIRYRAGMLQYGNETEPRFSADLFTDDAVSKLIDATNGRIQDALVYTDDTPVNDLKPAEVNANRTEDHTSTNTVNLSTRTAADVIAITENNSASALLRYRYGAAQFGYEAEPRPGFDLFTSDGASKLVDATTGRVQDALVYTDDTPLNDLQPAEAGAEVTTGKAIDILSDGSTYGRVLLTALSSGAVDLANAGVVNKLADNIGETATRFWAVTANADETANATSHNTTNVGSRPAADLVSLSVAAKTNTVRYRTGTLQYGNETEPRPGFDLFTDDAVSKLIDASTGRVQDALVYTDDTPINDLKPAEVNANRTEDHTSTNTVNVSTRAAADLVALSEDNSASALLRYRYGVSQFGNEAEPRPGFDIFTSDAATKLIDAATGRIQDGLVYSDDTAINDLKPAEAGAEVTTGKSLDILNDGSTYGRVLLTALSSGEVSLSAGGVIDKTADNIAESATRKWAGESGAEVNTVNSGDSITVFTGRTLDNISDSGTYGRVLLTALSTGQIDLSASGVVNKSADYVSESATRKWAAESGAQVNTIDSGDSITLLTGRTADNISETSSKKWAGQTGADITATIANQAPLMLSTQSAFNVRPILSAFDAGTTATITLQASHLYRGSVSSYVAYNSGSVTGLAFSTTYYVYADDPSLAGGAVTYHATTTFSDISSNDGRVYFGSVTTPADGGGSVSPPPCVAVNMSLGRIKAADAETGAPLYLLTGDDSYALDMVSGVEFSEAPCIEIRTRCASLVASVHTPLTLRDGTLSRLVDALGQEVAVLVDGDFRWETVESVTHMGTRMVAHVHCREGTSRTYAAGATSNALIFTHNPEKP